ncbi:MAG: glutamine-hydrolyzing carbamoyl-phosphate synthase small subunit [Myxococcales bacterium]|nr:glutamine-hydrolyzing carbamoyl-phosphate synthase small subunit [Myxococcales bacterium]
MKNPGYLVLADGTIFNGTISGELAKISGEVVFSTAMTGYAEILSDPSFFGQIVVLANPEIGNYGVNLNDIQSCGVKVRALVVKKLSSRASSFRSHMTLSDWLMREKIPIIEGIDTRALIAHIREKGAMIGIVTHKKDSCLEALVEEVKNLPPMANTRLSPMVSVKTATHVAENLLSIDDQPIKGSDKKFKVVVLDFGIKKELIRYLEHVGCSIILLPSDARIEEIWAHQPDGIFLSNGPGDPHTETIAVNTVRALLAKIPIFGVCMGHQVLAQALGMQTYKLKFGHRGSNQSVKLSDGSVIMTAQNHGFAVKVGEAPSYSDINLSDGSNEGIDRPNYFAFSVQFHPEGAPGPKDALNSFTKFTRYMEQWKKKTLSDSCPSAKNNVSFRDCEFVEDRDQSRA